MKAGSSHGMNHARPELHGGWKVYESLPRSASRVRSRQKSGSAAAESKQSDGIDGMQAQAPANEWRSLDHSYVTAPGDFAPPFGICCSGSLDFFLQSDNLLRVSRGGHLGNILTWLWGLFQVIQSMCGVVLCRPPDTTSGSFASGVVAPCAPC